MVGGQINPVLSVIIDNNNNDNNNNKCSHQLLASRSFQGSTTLYICGRPRQRESVYAYDRESRLKWEFVFEFIYYLFLYYCDIQREPPPRRKVFFRAENFKSQRRGRIVHVHLDVFRYLVKPFSVFVVGWTSSNTQIKIQIKPLE